ncbi:hypothetical protein HanRHA438_Chr08g0327421 [Helianthus annuus]|uniref:Uncharacterized protein n=1 Tax=Helianthus annuus TaxID=4232 RepID=A0A9K3IAX7_HELAN|nr:hypothetical protein HanXRQr2_Chr08g0317381 [Helianthus annuus]KAJ0537295.1 hypothetical protein HanHA300_Chr08g0261901 [Helianthus annuus]KAJ0551865.1 hypothetical protein HanHA89_Chr08g0278531 [Helianthus annuus]KAJ0717567.1 hypothetical protein HanLR1_Chr08g0260691 [Helianthus annuus]KAJ0720787.1 hypothetical protein HanOQP8_Chr08g0267971 [Helianthus annuus]
MDQVVALGYIFSRLLAGLIIIYVCVNESSFGCSKKLVHVVAPRWSHSPLTSLQPSTFCHRHRPPPQRLSSHLRSPGLPFRVIQILEVRTRLGYGT